jgi:hypothetical protein
MRGHNTIEIDIFHNFCLLMESFGSRPDPYRQLRIRILTAKNLLILLRIQNTVYSDTA